MLIKKDSKEAKVILDLLKFSNTEKTSTVVDRTIITPNHLKFFFNSMINRIEIPIETGIDNCYEIKGKCFVELIAGLLKKGDALVEFKNSKAFVNGFEFSCRERSLEDYQDMIKDMAAYQKRHLKFTKEQFAKLEKDFDISSLSFELPKVYDAITFGVIEGEVYEYCPSLFAKIAPVDATIDKVSFEQDFGHTDKIFIIPRNIYNLLKDYESVEFSFTGSITAITNCVNIVFSTMPFGTGEFKRRVGLLASKGESIKPEYLSKLKEDLSSFECFIDETESVEALFTFGNNKIQFEYVVDSDNKISKEYEAKGIPALNFNLQIPVANKIFSELDSEISVVKQDGIAVIKSKNNSFVIATNED